MAEPIELITLDFLKQHAKITTDLEDGLLAVYLTAARQRAEQYCNTVFVSQEVSEPFTIDQVCPIPAEDIVSVSGFFTSVAQLPTGYDWWVEYVKGISVNRQYPIDWNQLPMYTVRYRVTVDPADVPAAVKVAIARIASDLYENRENSGSQELGITAKTMLAAYRNI